jgi:hypothetical protein
MSTEAGQLQEAFAETGLTVEEAGAVATLMVDLREAGVDATIVQELRATLARYRALGFDPAIVTPAAILVDRLRALGITPADVNERLPHLDSLASALGTAGLADDRRDQALARMVEVGLTEADLGDLRAKKKEIADEIQELEADRAEYERSLAAVQDALAQACRKESEASQRVAALQKMLGKWGLTSRIRSMGSDPGDACRRAFR